MAGRLTSTSIAAPGFLGLNTQDSAVSLDTGYAIEAKNCIIDQYGRLASRKGWTKTTTSLGTLGATDDIESIHEFNDIAGTKTVISAGNLKFYTGTDTLVEAPFKTDDLSPGTDDTTVFSGNRWQFATLPEGSSTTAYSNTIATQVGSPALVYRRRAFVNEYQWQQIGNYGTRPSGVTTFDPDCCLSAFGRIWTAGLTSDKHTVFVSKLIGPADFATGDSGVLDIGLVLGNNDEIVALASHNGYLIIFCKNNIVIYKDPDTFASIALQDVITGVGCIARDSIQHTGTDLIFASKTGVRSLNRTIQEKSMPMRELSLNIRDDVVNYIAVEDVKNIRSAYNEKDAFYLITFPGSRLTIYFDLRRPLQNGSSRTALWQTDLGTTHTAFCTTDDRTLLVGVPGGIGEYTGYTDNTSSYEMVYLTPHADMEAPTVLKMLKRAAVIVLGSGEQDFKFKYGYEYTRNLRSQIIIKELGSGDFTKFYTSTTVSGTTTHASTYNSVGTVVTVTKASHGIADGTLVYSDFTSGTRLDTSYTTSSATTNTFVITPVDSAFNTSMTTSGNVSIITGGSPTSPYSLYGTSKYSSIGVGVLSVMVPLGGSGKVIQFGIESTIDGDSVSIQKIDVYLTTGKTI